MARWNRGGWVNLAGATIEESPEYRAMPTSGLAQPSGWLQDALAVSRSASGQRVSVSRALGLSAVWSAVSMISEQVGQLPLKVYRTFEEDDGDFERTEARSHRMWSILHDKPNSHTPADRFWSAVTAQILLYGNSFLHKSRGPDGMVQELFLLSPEQMTVAYDPNTANKSFLYQPIRMGEPRRQFSDVDLLHIFGLSLDGIAGLSVIQECRNALGAGLARDEFEGNFYQRGATLSGVLKHPNRLSPDAGQRLKTAWQALYGGSSRSHGTPVLEEGMEFVQIGSPLKDLEFVSAQNMSRTDIANMFKLPANYLGGSSGGSLTYATVESNQIEFAMHAISPVVNTIAKALSTDPGILPQNVFEAEFELKALMRGDSTSRADYYSKMASLGAITPNEIRKEEKLGPPLPGGDKPVLPTQERVSVSEPAPPLAQDVPNGDRQTAAAPAAPAAGRVNGNGNGAMPATTGS